MGFSKYCSPVACLFSCSCFFFSSRRRHTRLVSDWSSDVCSSDLLTTGGPGRAPNRAMLRAVGFLDEDFDRPMIGVASLFSDITQCNAHLDRLRSEERRVGKECRSRGSAYQ